MIRTVPRGSVAPAPARADLPAAHLDGRHRPPAGVEQLEQAHRAAPGRSPGAAARRRARGRRSAPGPRRRRHGRRAHVEAVAAGQRRGPGRADGAVRRPGRESVLEAVVAQRPGDDDRRLPPRAPRARRVARPQADRMRAGAPAPAVAAHDQQLGGLVERPVGGGHDAERRLRGRDRGRVGRRRPCPGRGRHRPGWRRCPTAPGRPGRPRTARSAAARRCRLSSVATSTATCGAVGERVEVDGDGDRAAGADGDRRGRPGVDGERRARDGAGQRSAGHRVGDGRPQRDRRRRRPRSPASRRAR